jgi:hypothetical protein
MSSPFRSSRKFAISLANVIASRCHLVIIIGFNWVNYTLFNGLDIKGV